MRSGIDAVRTGRATRRPLPALRFVLGALALAFTFSSVFSGCSSIDENWQTMDTQYDVDFAIAWEAVKLTLVEQFDTVEYERASEGVIRTGWKQELNYLVGAGVREKAIVNVKKADKGWAIRVRVPREENQEPIRTLDPRYAKWEQIADNAARAQHMVGLIHIKMKAITEP